MEHNRKLSSWWMRLQEFDYKVTYLEGKANVVADALSRLTTNKEVVPVEESLSDVVAMTIDAKNCCA